MEKNSGTAGGKNLSPDNVMQAFPRTGKTLFRRDRPAQTGAELLAENSQRRADVFKIKLRVRSGDGRNNRVSLRGRQFRKAAGSISPCREIILQRERILRPLLIEKLQPAPCRMQLLLVPDAAPENADGNDTYGLGKTQYDWLVKDLTDTSKKYKVVIMHKSLYSEGSHSYDKDVVGMRAQLTPLFAEKGVNLVLAGHDHVYNETFYLDGNGNKISTNANGKNEISTKGTLYVTMGTLGEKFYNYVDNPDVPTNTGESLHTDDGKLADPTFGKLVFDGEKLYYYGYQYVREYSSDGSFSGGSTVDIDKRMDINLIIALCLVGVVAVATVIAVITAAVKNRKR